MKPSEITYKNLINYTTTTPKCDQEDHEIVRLVNLHIQALKAEKIEQIASSGQLLA